MNNELLDLVNENDNIIGEVFRNEVHGDPSKIHREIVVILQNNKGEVLMQQRNAKKEAAPLEWDVSVSGHVRKGTTPEAEARKECMEELRWEGELRFFGKKFLTSRGYESHFLYLYKGKCEDLTKLKIDPKEVVQVKFMKPEEAEKNFLTKADADRTYWTWYKTALE